MTAPPAVRRAAPRAAYVVPALLALVPSCLALGGAVVLGADAWVDTDPWAGVGLVYAFVLAAPALASLTLLGIAHRVRRHSPGASQVLAWTAVGVIGLVALAAADYLAPR